MDYGSTRNINKYYNFAGKCATFPWGKSSSIAPIEIELPLTLTSFSQIIIIIIMITMKIEAILEKLGRGVEQRRKRIIEIPRQEEGRGRIKISWDFYASILLGWKRIEKRFEPGREFLAWKATNFPIFPGKLDYPPPLSFPPFL